MSRLNWERFGIRDVQKYKYIVAIDLGHRQTSAHCVEISEVLKKDINQCKLDERDNSLIPTQFAEGENGIIIVGDAAKGMKNPYIYFKSDPITLRIEHEGGKKFENGQYTRLELVQKYIGQIVKNIEKSNAELSGKEILYIVGCPSGDVWFQDENDVEYAAILAEGCNRDVVVMHESRGSLLKVREDRNIRFNRGEGIIVFDFGSSTADWTFMYTDEHGVVRMIDGTIPLGASQIDVQAMLKLLENAPVRGADKKEVINFINAQIDLIGKKEMAYTAGKNGAIGFDIVVKLNRPGLQEHENAIFKGIDVDFLDIITNKTQIEISSAERGKLRGTWESLCRSFMQEVMREINEQLPEVRINIVMLTGGASKMYFIEEICKEVFGGVDIIIDPDPANCVSKGLAIAGQLDVKSQSLAEEIKVWMGDYLTKLDSHAVPETIIDWHRTKNGEWWNNKCLFKDVIAAGVAEAISDDEFFEEVIHKALKYWKSEKIEDLSKESKPIYVSSLADIYGKMELKTERTKKKIEGGLNRAIRRCEIGIRNYISNKYNNEYGTDVPDVLKFKVSEKTLVQLRDKIKSISIDFASETAVRKLLGWLDGEYMGMDVERYRNQKRHGFMRVWNSREGLYNNFTVEEEQRRKDSRKKIMLAIYVKLRENKMLEDIANEAYEEFCSAIEEMVDSMALYAKKE